MTTSDQESNVTKEGIEVKVGQIWKDLDKRGFGRQCKVIGVKDGKAEMQLFSRGQLGAKTKISIRLMHKHSRGWALVR